MCGIFCMISAKHCTANINKNVEIFKDFILRRGPDSFGKGNYKSESLLDLSFLASVLWTQGEKIQLQPIENNKSIFVYNGDIFGGISDDIKNKTGDTLLLLSILQNAKNIPVELSRLHGPYAFIFFDKQKELLYFGRDIFGRTSLLIGKNDKDVVLTSVATRGTQFNFVELPSIGIFCWDLVSDELCLLPFHCKNQNFSSKLSEVEKVLDRNIIIKDEHMIQTEEFFFEPDSDHLKLYESIKNTPKDKGFEILLSTTLWLKKVLTLKELLEVSLCKRITTLPRFCKDCINNRLPCNHSLVGILFSGGVDCAILALLADKFVEKNRPIDLLNVAFDETNNYETPDRETGRHTFEALKQQCPDRDWRFIDINISRKELEEERKKHIANLIYPLNTVLDDGLGCAIWFASRGRKESFSSPCRVLLVGMGADELFGGYTKHRAAFKKGSWLGLHKSLNEDWQNLPHRNLARDDRVACDHGRLLRAPYLDEGVVEFVRNLQCWEKTFPSDEISQGFGEKLLLRSLAYYIGLKEAATFKKRALQFGSRIVNRKENAKDICDRLCI